MKFGVLLLASAILVYSCDSPSQDHKSKPVADLDNDQPQLQFPAISDTNVMFGTGEYEVSVRIRVPETDYKGTILVLQGWNFPNSSWSDSSHLDELMTDAGYALVMPEMGKSIYHKRVYEQTRKDWRKFPTRTWLVDTLLNDLDSRYQLFPKNGFNFVMGLSTGGRGAFIIAQENPTLFTAGASLSGDYDQSAFPEDNLYRGYFGTDTTKWSSDENPVSFANEWSVPMYVAHGAADSIVPVVHHARLQKIAEEQNLLSTWKFHVDESAGHNYQFWTAELEAILDFFNTFLK